MTCFAWSEGDISSFRRESGANEGGTVALLGDSGFKEAG